MYIIIPYSILFSYIFIFNFLPLACGTVINLATYKEHAIECKAKITKVYNVDIFHDFIYDIIYNLFISINNIFLVYLIVFYFHCSNRTTKAPAKRTPLAGNTMFFCISLLFKKLNIPTCILVIFFIIRIT